VSPRARTGTPQPKRAPRKKAAQSTVGELDVPGSPEGAPTPRARSRWDGTHDKTLLDQRLATARLVPAIFPHSGASGLVKLTAEWCPEPVLRFARDRTHQDPRTGIARFGPASASESRHPDAIPIGFVGTGRSVDAARGWFRGIETGVDGDPANGLPDFPGCTPEIGFRSKLEYEGAGERSLTVHQLTELKQIRGLHDRFQAAVSLMSEQVRMLSQEDTPPKVIVLALPEELLEITDGMGPIKHPQFGEYVPNLRRAIKAEVMKYGIPTQLLRPGVAAATPDSRDLDHPSRIAWNLMTSLFYKAGGVPWKPQGLRQDTCYVGISFHRPQGSDGSTIRTSVAQAFDREGVGTVLRGPDFPWNDLKDGKSPHLSAEHASSLLKLVLQRYESEAGRMPARVVVHKTSRFYPDERAGFEAALKGVSQFDLVAVAPTSEVRLVRAGQYPPLRGTLFTVGEMAYLYTTGWIPALQAYPHGHVPSPLQVADHHGDSSVRDLAKEILILTKMNWNASNFAGTLPITIRFSRLVGDIMREIPRDREPHPGYRFYT
jgi:hypothetical protein